jgi:hypothetical protein
VPEPEDTLECGFTGEEWLCGWTDVSGGSEHWMPHVEGVDDPTGGKVAPECIGDMLK